MAGFWQKLKDAVFAIVVDELAAWAFAGLVLLILLGIVWIALKCTT